MPTIAALALFGFFAHEVARRALEDELGRRLGTAAAGAAATLLPEQLRAFGAGDEDSLTYANVRRRLETARTASGRAARAGRDARAGGARRHVGARSRWARTPTSWTPTAPRSSARRAGRRPRRRCSSGTTASPTSAPTPRSARRATSPASSRSRATPTIRPRWRRFRRSMLLGPVSARWLAVLLLTVWLSRRISRPVARLAQAAARLGRGDLDAPIPIETRDEIGVLAQTLEETRGGAARTRRAHADDAGRHRPRGAQSRSVGSSCTPACCAKRWPASPSAWTRWRASNARSATSRRSSTSSSSSRAGPRCGWRRSRCGRCSTRSAS